MGEMMSEDNWDELAVKAFARMRRALMSHKGVRLSWEELEVMDRTFLGQVMAESEDQELESKPINH